MVKRTLAALWAATMLLTTGCKGDAPQATGDAAAPAPTMRCEAGDRWPEPEVTRLPLVWDHVIHCTHGAPRGQLRVSSQIANGADGPPILLDGVAITKITPPPIAKAWREILGEPGALTLQPRPPITVPPGKTVAFTVSGPYVADHDPGARRVRQVNFHMELRGRVEGTSETFALPINGHINTGGEKQVGPRPGTPGESELRAP